jgi:hypothetical protein
VGAPENEHVYGLRALPPALALVDLYGDSKGWRPDIDDLDIPQDQAAAVLAAAAFLKVKLPGTVRKAVENTRE